MRLAIVEAINRELDDIDSVEKAPDFHFVRDGLRALLEATKRVRDAESGAGTDANRKAYELVGGLARIYFDYTGKKPSASINGWFAQFVEAVNALIPERFQLNGADSGDCGQGFRLIADSDSDPSRTAFR